MNGGIFGRSDSGGPQDFVDRPRSSKAVVLELDGKQYQLHEGDIFFATINVKVEPVPGGGGSVQMNGSVNAHIKVVTIK
jgi:hypothetical protein